MSDAATENPVPQVPIEAADDAPLGDIEFSWANARHIVGSGFAMGSADVVPGVSGGTMAVACGIYGRLLAAIASINVESVKALLTLRVKEAFDVLHWRFILLLGAGIVFALGFMIGVVDLKGLLETQTAYVYSVFFGLVFASVFVLGKTIEWAPPKMGSFVAGAGIGFAIVNLVPMDLPSSPVHMFFYGMIAISAMLLPGISGSFILLILGHYETVIGALKAMKDGDLSGLSIVIPFALGCVVGILSFSRVVAWALRKWHDTVVAGLCGLLLGSLWRIWPYQELVKKEIGGKERIISATPYVPEGVDLMAIVLVILGFGAVFLVEYLASRRADPS